MRKAVGCSLVVLLAAVAGFPAAAAEVLRDAPTGLQVEAPPGYVARPAKPGRNQKARFEVKTPADTDTGCQVAYTPAPQNRKLTQAQINAMMRGEEWRGMARTSLSNVYDVVDTSSFQAGKREGLAVVADFKLGPNLPQRATLVRTLMVIQETPNGRTSTVCVGEKGNFEARQSEFLAVAAGATPP